MTSSAAPTPIVRIVNGRPVLTAADAYLLSYPKAGRTWLRALIGKALVDHYGLPERKLLRTEELTGAAGLPVAAFDHDQTAMIAGMRWQDMPTDRMAYQGSRVLLIGRDVRDNLVSAYFQATRRINVYAGTISEFIRHDAYGIEKILAFYRIWSESRHIPTTFDFIKYEDLHRDTAGSLRRVLAFLGATVRDSTIRAAVDYCRFENLRKAEIEDRFRANMLRPARTDDPEAFKLRQGKVGNYSKYLSTDDIAYIDAAVTARGCEFAPPAKVDNLD